MNPVSVFYPFASLLTDRAQKTLSSLLQLTRDGHRPPLAVDFIRLTEKNSNSNFSLGYILGQILDDNYQFRHELLLDLIGFLFWHGRIAWRPCRLAAIPWSDVRANQHRYRLPHYSRINVTQNLPSIQLMRHTHDILVPHRDCGIEDAAFSSIFDILVKLPVDDSLTDFPQISLDKLCDKPREAQMVFVSRSGNGDPIFADEEIDDCSHVDCYCESVLRFTMLLMNQYFWSSESVTARYLFELEPNDRLVVCTNELKGEVFGNDRSAHRSESDQAWNLHHIRTHN